MAHERKSAAIAKRYDLCHNLSYRKYAEYLAWMDTDVFNTILMSTNMPNVLVSLIVKYISLDYNSHFNAAIRIRPKLFRYLYYRTDFNYYVEEICNDIIRIYFDSHILFNSEGYRYVSIVNQFTKCTKLLMHPKWPLGVADITTKKGRMDPTTWKN